MIQLHTLLSLFICVESYIMLPFKQKKSLSHSLSSKTHTQTQRFYVTTYRQVLILFYLSTKRERERDAATNVTFNCLLQARKYMYKTPSLAVFFFLSMIVSSCIENFCSRYKTSVS
jgi:oligoribonuclease (3'-5' exoribonuclease)